MFTERRLERDHEAIIEVVVHPPWLPGSPFHGHVWSRGNLSCRVSFDECLSLHIPQSQLIEGIGLETQTFFLVSVENDILIKLGLKYVVVFEDTGTKLTES